MYLRLLAAGLVAALPLAGAPAATAADLSNPYDPTASGSPYDDPRYADIYGDPEPASPYRHRERLDVEPYAGPHYAEPRFEEHSYAEPPYEEPRRWQRHSRWRGEYLEPMPYAPDFEEHRARTTYARPDCVPRHEIRRELARDGWSDLHGLETRDRFEFINARRPNGQLYRLKIDRCGGGIIRARRIEHSEDSYAWRRRQAYPAY